MARIDRFLEFMVQNDLSDLHITAQLRPMARKHGEMVPISQTILSDEILRETLFEILDERKKELFTKNMDLDFAYSLPGTARFRVNYFMQSRGIAAVFRLIPATIKSVAELGLPDIVLKIADYSRGLIVVTGPTGSGKSTTLAAMIDHLNRTRNDHIITIEDPIEFVHQSNKCLVNQREVSNHTMSFSTALRASLREDPDIVLVGEMRDLETIELALNAAETGHLVFATLHTSSAPKTVDRIINVFPEGRQAEIRTMLADSLVAVYTQTLFARADGKGRIPGLEILFNTPAIANLIRENKIYQIPGIMQTGKSIGMQILDDVLMGYVKDKLITPEEAYQNASQKELFEKMLTQKQPLVPNLSVPAS